MAQAYQVKTVDPNGHDWSNTHGADYTSYRCTLDGIAGDVEIVKKRGNSPPRLGEEVYGRLESKTVAGYTWRFFTEQRPGQQNTGGGLSPQAEARIDAVGRVKGRCHAQAVAADLVAYSGTVEKVDFSDDQQAGAFLNGPYRRLVNWLVNDAESARNNGEA